MRILFLDFDGVLNSRSCDFSAASGRPYLNPKMGQRLQQLCSETAARLVVVSTWRVYLPFEQLQARLVECGVTAEVIGCTPDLLADSEVSTIYLVGPYLRGKEVDWWLQHNGEDVSSYAILDDVDDYGPRHKDRLILTDYAFGLQDSDVALARQKLLVDHA